MKTLTLPKGYLLTGRIVSYNTACYGVSTRQGVFMSTLNTKRLAVVILSQIIGFAIAYLIITVGFNALPLISSIKTPQGRSPAEYGTIYFIVTAVPIGIIIMIWMDQFLDTRILPD
jgi:hypothetical protein